ncbi:MULTISPECIES: hypothetical protein [Oleiagrimonas]|uniref:Uncharacterized protein n=1 Tax=Oleiagrimonas citrea TaxID=1665687 RepID=A0A846ZL53_9GAMM|nr:MULTISPECIES: hypothetical protein [Oleiagrimonas]NKZ38914.1 hypothetical protein [Oleiagrimonas citrea]RAP57569.1 hypothetical protein BTJ49_06515 [Oleiagrimonas sp. MCCC 1A03011]
MKQHWDFFKDSDSSFGLFYPLHYTMAAFEVDTHAERARQRFLEDGFAEDDVATASGPFVADRLESMDDANWFDRLRAQLADLVGTETGYLQDDRKLAQRGGAFLFVYTPDQDRIDRAHALIERLHPIYARRYHYAGIENIRYPAQSKL